MIPLNKEDINFEVQAALAWHENDACATIATLLEDIRHLRKQLILSEGAMSRGMTRSWIPTLERK